jgi:hypothetical protein
MDSPTIFQQLFTGAKLIALFQRYFDNDIYHVELIHCFFLFSSLFSSAGDGLFFSFSGAFFLLQEMVTVSADGSVLDRIAKIMSYLRLGSSGKVLKKKKKERDTKGVLIMKLSPVVDWKH